MYSVLPILFPIYCITIKMGICLCIFLSCNVEATGQIAGKPSIFRYTSFKCKLFLPDVCSGFVHRHMNKNVIINMNSREREREKERHGCVGGWLRGSDWWTSPPSPPCPQVKPQGSSANTAFKHFIELMSSTLLSSFDLWSCYKKAWLLEEHTIRS